MKGDSSRCDLPVGTFVEVTEYGDGQRYIAVIVGYDLGRSKYEVGHRYAGWGEWRWLDGGAWVFPGEVEEIKTKEVSFESENVDEKPGVVTYTIPA
ncbi:hypothetical protein [Micromonospora sp. NPDC047730]|uniref:hypothetical protein n=1 Tax=Micromonospora sp. NPDC047730 TaxID=3364253 RepID=UPI0037121CBB